MVNQTLNSKDPLEDLLSNDLVLSKENHPSYQGLWTELERKCNWTILVFIDGKSYKFWAFKFNKIEICFNIRYGRIGSAGCGTIDYSYFEFCRRMMQKLKKGYKQAFPINYSTMTEQDIKSNFEKLLTIWEV